MTRSTGTPAAAAARPATPSIQEDLLDELRRAAPIPPAPRPTPRAARPDASPRPASAGGTTAGGTTVELHVAPQRWSPPRVSGHPGRAGLIASIGPVRLSLRLSPGGRGRG